jgi:hypothetical protein
MRVFRKTTTVFVLLSVMYTIYAALYIYRNSVVVEGQRYFVLFDDAMVSMRYARNLVNGEGLVWNPGERVEGFTNPLWVFFMAVVHLLPLSDKFISLPVQIAGVLFFIACLYFTLKIAEEIRPDAAVPLLAVGLTAFYAQLSTWNLLGMEVSGLLPIATAAVWMAIKVLKEGRFSPWLYLLLGVGTLVRMDMAVLFLAILVFMSVFDAANRQKHLLWGIGLLVVFSGGQTLLRHWYYGEWLPNTYYLKVTGAPVWLMVKNGLYVFLKFVWRFNPVLFTLPFIYALTWRTASTWREKSVVLLLAWVFVSFCAYSIYVGGDSWESKGGANRFIATGLPLFFILLACALESIFTWGKRVNPEADQPGEALLKFGVVGFAFVGLAEFCSIGEMDFIRFWLGLAGVIGLLAGLGGLAIVNPKRQRWYLVGSMVVYCVSVLALALHCRQLAVGDILPNAGAGISFRHAFFNSLRIMSAQVFSLKGIWFWLPWVVVLLPPQRWTKALGWCLWAAGAMVIIDDGSAWTSIGGANRFVSALLPMALLLLVWTFAGVRASTVPPKPVWIWLSPVVGLAFALICLVNFNALLEMSSLKPWLLLQRHPFISGSERLVQIAHLVEQVSTPEAKVAVVTAGIIPYYTHRYSIDLLGKVDKTIARQPMHITTDMSLANFRPGHMKWDYTHSIRDLKPDVIAQVYDESPREERLQWVTSDYTSIAVGTITFYVRDDSPYIRWDAVSQLQGK